MSGFCSAGTATATYDPHARCTLDGCVCACHKAPARPKVPLACLQGRHTDTCGHDGLLPAGVQLVIDDEPDRIELRDALDGRVVGAINTGPAPVELTVDERRRVIAAHMHLDPGAALEVARIVLTERLNP